MTTKHTAHDGTNSIDSTHTLALQKVNRIRFLLYRIHLTEYIQSVANNHCMSEAGMRF